MTLIAEATGRGEWTCHRSDHPARSVGGTSSLSAFRRCCEIYGVDPLGFSRVEETPACVVFRRPDPCRQCGGSGKYVGLAVVESCAACEGRGVA